MATADQYILNEPFKGLFVGHTGSGKTGALASLANAGMELFVLDFDRGVQPLIKYTKPEFRKNIHIETLTDKLKPLQIPKTGGNYETRIICDGVPTAFVRSMNLLTRWKAEEGDFGNIGTWGRNRVLVLDSLTLQGDAAMRYVLSLQGRNGQQPFPADWQEGQRLQRSMLELLYSDAVKCHVIIMAHLKSVREGTKTVTSQSGKESEVAIMSDKMFPTALGNAMPTQVGRYFNIMLYFKTVGSERMIYTKPADDVDVKIAADVKPVYRMENGVLEIFKAVCGDRFME